MDYANQIIFIQLADDVLKKGKPFEGLTHGKFVDMDGRRVTIRKKDLETMVANTRELIATTETESGEIVGLPVDAFGHDQGDGAGWVKGVELSEDSDKILFQVEWTEIGYELISKKIRRWFSATLSLAKRTIFGGTLTNWPAVRDKNGKYLLTPIELSQNLHQLSLNGATTLQTIRRIERAFYSEFGYDEYWITDVDLDDNAVIISFEGDYYAVGFELADDDMVVFADEEDWKRAQRNWKILSKTLNKVKTFMRPKPTPEKRISEDLIMNDETRSEIKDMISAAVSEALADLSAQSPPPAVPPSIEDNPEVVRNSLQEILDLDGMTAELGAEIGNVLQEQVASVQRLAQAEFAQRLAVTKRRAVVTELCSNITQGTSEIPRGIPLDAEELKKHLLELDPASLEFFSAALDTIWRNGMVEFAELGHQNEVKGNKALPDEVLAKLRSGEIELGDLTNPIIAPMVGDLSQYDLSEFKG